MNEDQFKRNYKKAVNHMTTNDQMKKRLEQRMNSQSEGENRQRKRLYIGASVVIAASIGLAAPIVWQQVNEQAAPATQVAQVNPVVIPKTEIPNSNSNGIMGNMQQLVVYQGNVYTQSATSIDGADALALRGEKIGTTTGGIHELSSQDEYTELASNIGEADIYAVNGYDTDFRIMSYTEIDGEVYAELFDQNNGITVGSGADLFGKLQLEGNVTSAQWESFASWNNGLLQLRALEANESLDHFISALYSAKPAATSPELEERLYSQEDRNMIYLTLKDKTKVQLVLFGEGLVRYGNVPVFFEVDEDSFLAFWNDLKE